VGSWHGRKRCTMFLTNTEDWSARVAARIIKMRIIRNFLLYLIPRKTRIAI